MISRYDASLNGVSISSINPAIVVTDIQYAEAGRKHQTYSLANMDGGQIYQSTKEKASVTILFMIRAYDVAERQRICRDIGRWAQMGGELKCNDREGQKLVCVCDAKPYISSAMRWTDNLPVTFTAYEIPYWQEVSISSLSLSGANGSGTLFVPGDAPETLVETTITASAALSSVSLTVNGKTMTLSELSIASGESIVVSYDEHGILSIKTGTTSLLNKRTGADDLRAVCGEKNSVSFTASASCTVVFRARGRWD